MTARDEHETRVVGSKPRHLEIVLQMQMRQANDQVYALRFSSSICRRATSM